MKCYIPIAAATVALVLVASIGITCFRAHQLNLAKAKAEAEQKAVMASLYGDVKRILGDFHADVMSLTPSASGVVGLENEMHRLKSAATRRLEQMHQIEAKVAKLPSIPVTDCLVEATEKSVKYLEGCSSWANLETEGVAVRTQSETMVSALEMFRTKAGLTGSPDKGDVAGEVIRVGNIASNLIAARKQAEVAAVAATAVAAKKAQETNDADSEAEYWKNTEYAGYRRQTRSIVQRYVSGRTILAAVLGHYDSGNYTAGDRANLVDQYNLRQGLIQEINQLSGNIPPGSVYSILHAELRQMLTDACAAMDQFAGCPNGANRAYLSSVSERNGVLLHRLQKFYGID